MLCTDRDILEKEENTQALSAFYDYFSDAPAEGYGNGFPHQVMNISMMCIFSHFILI